jgi:hypothetical protein
MRTRFLATDYFEPPPADASSDQAVALAALPFPSLPVPTFPPDPYLPDPDPFPADLLPAGNDLDSFPVASALSEFLAAVVPRLLPVPDIPDTDEVSPPHLRGSRSLVAWVLLGNFSDYRSLEVCVVLLNFVVLRWSHAAFLNCNGPGVSRREWMTTSTAGAGTTRVLAGRILLRAASPRQVKLYVWIPCTFGK